MSTIVEVKKGNLEEALRILKKKMEVAKVMEDFNKHQFYLKPSLKKREKRKRRLKYG